MTRTLNFGDAYAPPLANAAAVIHVRYAGQSFDIPLAGLDVGTFSDDGKIKRSLACRLRIAPDRLDGYVIDRHANGNLTIRPEAVFDSNTI